jgi:hypothetical protein
MLFVEPIDDPPGSSEFIRLNALIVAIAIPPALTIVGMLLILARNRPKAISIKLLTSPSIGIIGETHLSYITAIPAPASILKAVPMEKLFTLFLAYFLILPNLFVLAILLTPRDFVLVVLLLPLNTAQARFEIPYFFIMLFGNFTIVRTSLKSCKPRPRSARS